MTKGKTSVILKLQIREEKKKMTRAKKEQFKNNIKLFYLTTIESQGYFSYLDKWILFNQASRTYGISYRTAQRYFWQLVPRDFIQEYEI